MERTQRVNRICLRGTVASRGEARELTKEPGDAVLVERGVVRSLILRCPCTCGDDLILNLDDRAGPSWRFYRRRGHLTVFPSYWRDTACESHFILWNDQILWCDRWGYDHEDSPDLREPILGWMGISDYIDYQSVAVALDAIPWDILWTCQRLVGAGLLEERSGKVRGHFRRVRIADPKNSR